MHQLSGLDAAFLYLESDRTPMHVGGVYIFGGSPQTELPGFQTFKTHMANRLDVARTFRQRLVSVPLNLDHPYWIEDPDFDLEAHLYHRVLKRPGRWRNLMALAEEIFSRPLDRNRPLWALAFVEGLDEENIGGSFALIVKAHHAAVDGLSGEEMIWALLDPKPGPLKRQQPKSWQPESTPSRFELLTRTAGRTLGYPFTVARTVGQLVAGAGQLARQKIRHPSPWPPLPLMAPPTPFNNPVTSNRLLRTLVMPFPKIQAIRKVVTGATVNDVVLAICAGALRRYLKEHQALPEKPLVAAVPIAVRQRDSWQGMGNQLSAMLVSLATDERDPRKRFQLIHRNVMGSKQDFQAIDLQQLTDLIPSTTTGLISQLYSGLNLSQRLNPFFNLFITNVPGPRQPLYLGKARLLYHLGTAPIFDGLGLILVVTSYVDTLVISITSCRDIMPDPDGFLGHLQASFEELEALSKSRA